MPLVSSKATGGLPPLTSARSASHTARFKAAMFGLIPSIHDGGEFEEGGIIFRVTAAKRVHDGGALVVDAVGGGYAA